MGYSINNNRPGKSVQIRATSNAVITINDITFKESFSGTANSITTSSNVTGTGGVFTNAMVGGFLWSSANVFVGRVSTVTNGTFLTLTSNAAVAANGNMSFGKEAVQNFNISKLYFSTAGTITITRGANTTELYLKGTDHWNLDTDGMAWTEGSTGNLNIYFSDTASTVIIDAHKNVRFGRSDYLGASNP
jgi:hypothetical protein